MERELDLSRNIRHWTGRPAFLDLGQGKTSEFSVGCLATFFDVSPSEAIPN